jgi:hypothetical protein
MRRFAGLIVLALVVGCIPPEPAPTPEPPAADAGEACTGPVNCACAQLWTLGCAQGGDGCEEAFEQMLVDRLTYVDLECVAVAPSKQAVRACAGIGERGCP